MLVTSPVVLAPALTPAATPALEPTTGAMGRAQDALGRHPEPRLWTAQFVQAALEVCAGVRPAVQLVRWTTADVQATLARRGSLASHGRAPSMAGRATFVRSVHLCAPAEGVWEACCVVGGAARLRAVAVRVERFESRWRCTAFETC